MLHRFHSRNVGEITQFEHLFPLPSGGFGVLTVRVLFFVAAKKSRGNKKDTRLFGMWVFPKMGVPPNHPLKNRVFPNFPIINHPFWGVSPYFLETPHVLAGTSSFFSPIDLR